MRLRSLLDGKYLLVLLSVCLVLAISLWAGFKSRGSAAPAGLVAAYGFNEANGTSLNDSSGNSNNGVISGASWSAGKYGSALSFNVSARNNWVTVPHSSSLLLSNAMTLEAWVNPSILGTTSTSWRTVVFKERPGGMTYSLYANDRNARPRGQVYIGAEQTSQGSSTLPLNTWTHLAVTYDNSSLKLYINGTQVATKAQTGTIFPSTGALKIGGNAVWGEWFGGLIDEVRIYSRALSASEIQTDMTTPVTVDNNPPSAPTNLRQTSATETSVSLSWSAASDDVAVAGYNLYNNMMPAGTSPSTTGTINGLNCGTSYLAGVQAVDSSGNLSQIETLNIATEQCDTSPPTIQITSPTAGSQLSGEVTVTAAAADNKGVTEVQFKVDGNDLGSVDTSPPYSVIWNTAIATAGNHTLTALATDSSNNQTISEPIVVQVENDTISPTVDISEPPEGATVTGNTLITANASDNVAVAGVQFKVDNLNVGGEDTSPPFSVTWNSTAVGNGTHLITAVARDFRGNTTASAPRQVNVLNTLNTADAWKRVVVGPGYVDASTRAVVRTANDRVYVFAADDTARGNGVGPTVIRAWKANRSGIPTAFNEMDPANKPTAAPATLHALGSPDVRLDRNGIAHLVYLNESDDSVNYITFSTHTDQWGPREIVASGIGIDFDGNNSYRRETTNALILDGAENPHIVYRVGTNLVYRNRIGGSWSLPQLVTTATQGTPRHTQMAADATGNFHLSWLESYIPAPAIKYNKRTVSGVWEATETVASTNVLSNESSDQGPSIIVNQSGMPYVLYVSAKPDSGVQTKHRATDGSWVANNPPTNTFTHAPQIYGQYNDIYAFLGHDSNVEFGYRYQLANQPWSNYIKLDRNGNMDGSASPRWDPQRENNPNVIDVTYYEENLFNDSRHLGEIYYMAVLPSGTGLADTEAPSQPAALSQTATTENSISLSWAPSSDNSGVSGYTVYKNNAAISTTTTTSATIAELSCNTSYDLAVDAFDSSGNHSPKATIAATTSLCDTNSPNVQITEPASGTTISGAITIKASAFDNTGIAAVQFKVNNQATGSEDKSSPYEVSWNSYQVGNGEYQLTAVARDLSGNLATSDPVTIVVNNNAQPGLVAAYSFNEGGGGSLLDSSGNANHGTIREAVWTTAGKFGGALTFDGINDWVTVNDHSSLDLTSAMTLQAWVRPTGGSSWRTAIIKEQPGDLVYALYAKTSKNNNAPSAHIFVNGLDERTYGTSLLLNSWTHLAATYDGSTLRLYINGVLASSLIRSGVMPTSTGVLRFGGNAVWNEWLKGELDEIRIYNRALSAAEIQADMGKPVN